MRSASPSRPLPVRSSASRSSRGSGRWGVASRAVAAIFGGYALAAFFSTTIALLIREPREEAVMIATIPSFLLFAGAVVWAFCSSTALRAWVGIGGPALILAGATWFLKHGGAAS